MSNFLRNSGLATAAVVCIAVGASACSTGASPSNVSSNSSQASEDRPAQTSPSVASATSASATASESSVDTEDTAAPASSKAEKAPAGPELSSIDGSVTEVIAKLTSLDGLPDKLELDKAGLSIVTDKEAELDVREAPDGKVIQNIVTPEGKQYMLGVVGEKRVARLAVACGEKPADVLVMDQTGRSEKQWAGMVEKIEPVLVKASGCERTGLEAPTGCLDLPDDPGACAPGEGQSGLVGEDQEE